jgi:hypothetical protein
VAKDPAAEIGYLSYKGGTMAAPRGLLTALFGGTVGWKDPRAASGTPGGPRRRLFGSKQRTSARSGKLTYIKLANDAGTFSCRITGATMDFVGELVVKTGSKIEEVYTARGSLYTRQFLDT